MPGLCYFDTHLALSDDQIAKKLREQLIDEK